MCWLGGRGRLRALLGVGVRIGRDGKEELRVCCGGK